MAVEKRILLVKKIVFDVILLVVVSIPIPFFYGTLKPYHRGFYCDDESIRYPYKESTISDAMLYSIGTSIGFIVIFVTEIVRRNETSSAESTQLWFHGYQIPAFLRNIYSYSGVFFFGASVTELTTDIMKYVIGRLRPNFFDSCLPDVDCTAISDPTIYIEKYICLNDDYDVVSDSRLSFPSGHSSYATFTMVYVVLYLQKRFSCKTTKLLKPFLQYVFLLIALLTALSRITDSKHHWSDVLIGFLLGLTVCILLVFHATDLFKKAEDTYLSRSKLSSQI